MTDEANDVVVRRVVQASRELAFETWTAPEHVKRWWRPTETALCTLCEIDLQTGGHYRLHMSDPADGTMCEVNGEFQVIEQPVRLAYTWHAKTDQGEVENTLVSVEFHELGEQATEIIVRHSGLPDAPIREGHREGWEKMLVSLAHHLASAPHKAARNFRMSLEYDVPAETLFSQFSSAEGVGNWWTKDCDVDPRVGGKASFRFGDSGFYAHMEFARLERPRLVEWMVLDAKHPKELGLGDPHDWNGTRIRFEITPLGETRSRVDFTHFGLAPLECSVVCTNLWAHYLNGVLRRYLEHGKETTAG